MRTLARRKQQGRFDVAESERLHRIAALFDHAATVMGSEASARAWLTHPVRGLGDREPCATPTPSRAPGRCTTCWAASSTACSRDRPGLATRPGPVGGDWAQSRVSPVLAVPGVVVPVEANYLLNPAHPDFARIRIGFPDTFRFDPRLFAAPGA